MNKKICINKQKCVVLCVFTLTLVAILVFSQIIRTSRLSSQTKAAQPQISGGADSFSGEFPYMAALYWSKLLHEKPAYSLNEITGEYDYDLSGSIFCGGTLINPNYIVTAAHCLFRHDNTDSNLSSVSPFSPSELGIMLNRAEIKGSLSSKQDLDTTFVEVEKIILPPEVSGVRSYFGLENIKDKDDIALIKLKNYSQIKTASLPSLVQLSVGDTVFLLGYGNNIETKVSILQRLETGITAFGNNTIAIGQDQSFVMFMMQRIFSKNSIKAICMGDSGGPMILKENNEDILVGILASGSNMCGISPSNSLDVRTKLQWIEDNAK